VVPAQRLLRRGRKYGDDGVVSHVWTAPSAQEGNR